MKIPLATLLIFRIPGLFWIAFVTFATSLSCRGDSVPVAALFRQGTNAYAKGDFEQAALCFRSVANATSSAGAWHNLGNSEWQSGHPGPAILAWERGRWLDPFDSGTRENLRFARKARQLDSPELTWYETAATWLPADAWPWIASLSFWTALSLLMLPGIFGCRKAGWHQGIAASCFAIFLLTLPAIFGVQTLSRIGVLLPEATPLRLTPTSEAQVLGKLPPGETVRLQRSHGDFVYIRTDSGAGWIRRSELSMIAGPRGEGF